MATFIKSNKGKTQLVFENYRFRCTKSIDTTEYWTCVQCNATVITVERVVKKHGNHDHAINMEDINCARLQSNLRQRALDEPLSELKTIYNTEVASAAQAGANVGSLPTFNSVRSSMYRKRRGKNIFY